MKAKSIIILIGITISLLNGCTTGTMDHTQQSSENAVIDKLDDISYQVNPETFQMVIIKEGREIPVSAPHTQKTISDYQEKENDISWNYPNDEITVNIDQEINYINVSITYYGNDATNFNWPQVKAQTYALPLGEGKWIPSDDPVWIEYLGGETQDTIESFSMNFFAAGHGDDSIVYVMDNSFDNQVIYGNDKDLDITISHQYTTINANKTYGFRIYATDHDPTSISKIYRNDLLERGLFKTLEDKAIENPNIEKLYGAIHMYMFDMTIVSEEDIKWSQFRQEISSDSVAKIETFIRQNLEGHEEFSAVIHEIKSQDYVSQYQKNVICRALNDLLRLPVFQNTGAFENEVQILKANKAVLYEFLPAVFHPIESWGNDRTTDLLNAMSASGIHKAWVGLDNWDQAYSKPELVSLAEELGYLIAPYDSYHSIHEKGKEQWHTAALDDGNIFDTDTITNIAGQKISGFKGEGRKLNPTLTLSLVKNRVSYISNLIHFNSWFIDCDATGEVFNDYTLGHETTKEMDINARLERMEWIKDEAGMVIGSEGGNDFSAPYMAFAHGIELPSFSWMDEDMKDNKESEYYIGRCYVPNGGAPEKMTKPIPVKEKYKNIFLNPVYNIPLFKLVYNDSLITTYHWDWSTLKIMDEVENRMMYEMLYNVPPLYHIDKFQWEENKDIIVSHAKEWSDFSKDVINKEMTDFQILSDDRLVQMTEFEKTKVIANFSNTDFSIDNNVVPANGFIIIE